MGCCVTEDEVEEQKDETVEKKAPNAPKLAEEANPDNLLYDAGNSGRSNGFNEANANKVDRFDNSKIRNITPYNNSTSNTSGALLNEAISTEATQTKCCTIS